MCLRPSHVLLISIVAFLTACTTPYQPKGFRGGYSQVQLDNNTVRVEFKGNGYTSRERVEVFLLYRCAELTAEKGYDFFVIGKQDTETHQQTTQTQGRFQSTTIGDRGFYSTSGTYTPGQPITFHKRTATAVIKMFKGEKPVEYSEAFTAREIIENLQSQYQELKH